MATGSVSRYCSCRDPHTGRQHGTDCPELTRSDKHGRWQYRDRLLTSSGIRQLRRRGFRTRREANQFRDHLHELLALTRGDRLAEARLGDLVLKLGRGQPLPPVEDVRRRLGIGMDLDGRQLLGPYLREWLKGKRRLRASAARSYEQHVSNWLEPHLGHLPLSGVGRLSDGHIADLFDLIEEFNQELRSAAEQGRKPELPRDVRRRAKIVGVATQHRIFATLRNALNAAVRRRLIDVNPCGFVELAEVTSEPPQTWTPEQVGQFLAAVEDDRLYGLWRLALLFGPRRGEMVGARRSAWDLATRSLRVVRPLLQLGGEIVESPGPKTRAGERIVYVDPDTAELIQRDVVQRARERLEWGEVYQDNDLIWCREDGTPYPPDWVSRRFKELARAAGVPVIRMHDARHTAATLRLEARVDIKIVSEQLGHSKTGITRDLYQHVRRAVLDDATAKVIDLLPARRARDARGVARRGAAD